MKTTQETIKKMYEFARDLYEDGDLDIYWLKSLYNDISEEFDLDLEFWIDGCEYWWDEEIYCYTYVNNIWSIVFNRWVRQYTDGNFYKDTVNYLLELQEEAEEIQKKLLPINQ